MALRRSLYRRGILRTTHFEVPIIVVGNLTVGGTGKTPVIIALVELLQEMGFKPGIVSRGYGGTLKGACLVTAASEVSLVGDEPLLLARRLNCPLAIGSKRVEAVKMLLAHHDCDVVLSDDGLQHLAMGRAMELILVGERQFGNGFCLPAGPLRESVKRLQSTHWVIYHSRDSRYEHRFILEPHCFRSVLKPELTRSLEAFAHKSVEVVVAIGYPQRFLETLQALQIKAKAKIFRDHHAYTEAELLAYKNKTLLMTEKDAVKCAAFDLPDAWYLEVSAVLSESLQSGLRDHFLMWKNHAHSIW
jgi:tetraacyldisaccharide 4'-kinase